MTAVLVGPDRYAIPSGPQNEECVKWEIAASGFAARR
jgi:hypothetical protein